MSPRWRQPPLDWPWPWFICRWCPVVSASRTSSDFLAAVERLPRPAPRLLPHRHPLHHPVGACTSAVWVCADTELLATAAPMRLRPEQRPGRPCTGPARATRARRRTVRHRHCGRRRGGYRRRLQPAVPVQGLCPSPSSTRQRCTTTSPAGPWWAPGVFNQADTVKTMASLIPAGVEWIKAAVGTFEPEQNRVTLEKLAAGLLPAPDRGPRDKTGLARDRGAGGEYRSQRRDLQLSLRPGALHLATGEQPQAGPRPVHPAAHADQVRRSAAEGAVPYLAITGAVPVCWTISS